MKKVYTLFIAFLLFSTIVNAQWADYQAAEFVVGQPDFTTYQSACSVNGLNGPYSVAIDFQHSKLYIGDADNCRVLRYSYPLTSNQPTPELVFVQTDFTSNPAQVYFSSHGYWPSPTASQILNPMSLAVYNGDLWVLDEFNSRVVKFSQAYNQSVNNPDANIVIGQSNFTSINYSCSVNLLKSPWGMSIDSLGNLWVTDSGHNRVLKFSDVSSLNSGAGASMVLGQSNFTTGIFTSSATQNQFGLPTSVYIDGTTAWICDRGFNRILRFDNVYQKSDGANADAVLGQVNFTSSTTGLSRTTLNQPFAVCTDAKGNLYVSDQTNNRVLIYLDAAKKTNGAKADNVLGQTSFSGNYGNYGDKGFAPSGSVANFAIDNSRGKLLVIDRIAARVLQFAASGVLTGIEQNELLPDFDKSKPFNLSVFPNPVATIANLKFHISNYGDFSLKIYNASGNEIKVLINKKMDPGIYTVQWNAINEPAGIYICRLFGGVYSESILITLIE